MVTNSAYGKLCRMSLKRIPSRYRSQIDLHSFSSLEDVKLPARRVERTLFVSRLSDIPKESVEKVWEAAESKHLLFLEGLPVEAMPSRLLRLNIRNPHRLHLAAERSPTLIVDLVCRLFTGMAHSDGPRPIVDAWMENEQLVLLSPSFERLAVGLDKLAKYISTDENEVNAFEIDEDGRFLYWPHADVHMGWQQFLELFDPTAALADKQKSEQFNESYGAAIRSFREEQGIKQSDVRGTHSMGGITERHLRRVEHGQQPASKATLEALARAHEMPLGDYLKALAKGVGKRER